MPGRTAFVTHHDCSRHDTGWKHPEHQGRLPAVARAVHRDMLALHDRLVEVEGTPAESKDLSPAHDPTYVQRLMARADEAAAAGGVLPLEGQVMVSGASGDAVLAAVGCVLTAVKGVREGRWNTAFCAVRPPGHGAFRDRPGGYSLVNAVAVAAQREARRHEAAVWVVDVGARRGTGSRAMLAGEDGVLFVEVHEDDSSSAERAPAGGDGVISRELAEGAGGDALLRALRSALDEAEGRSIPSLVLLSLGCDALGADPLGGLALEPADYHPLTAEVRARAERLCGGRLVSVLEEGYAPEAMGEAVVQHLRALTDLPPRDG